MPKNFHNFQIFGDSSTRLGGERWPEYIRLDSLVSVKKQKPDPGKKAAKMDTARRAGHHKGGPNALVPTHKEKKYSVFCILKVLIIFINSYYVFLYFQLLKVLKPLLEKIS